VSGRAHLLLAALTVVALGYVLGLLRSGRLRARFALLWTVVGIGLAVMAAFPSLLDWTAERLGVFYPPAVFLMAATAFLFVVAVQFSWEISRLEERTRVLAEEIALLRRERADEPARAPAEAGDSDEAT
jgi:hypothetical protein